TDAKSATPPRSRRAEMRSGRPQAAPQLLRRTARAPERSRPGELKFAVSRWFASAAINSACPRALKAPCRGGGERLGHLHSRSVRQGFGGRIQTKTPPAGGDGALCGVGTHLPARCSQFFYSAGRLTRVVSQPTIIAFRSSNGDATRRSGSQLEPTPR